MLPLVLLPLLLPALTLSQNTSYTNPILPGFHPDPSCTYVPEWNQTIFCASSSFNAFPAIPIHATTDLQNYKLISNVLSRPEQLPALATTNRSTAGIWAPTIRYHDGLFYVTTTLVFDDRPKNQSDRWDNLIFTSPDPFDSSSWSDPVHFDYIGYDVSPYWDDETGEAIMTGSHEYSIWPGITQSTINLTTGAWTGSLENPWNGTGGLAPEGPHLYKKDGYFYLLLAEGGTGNTHMVTMARSRHINGPYEPAPHNPVLSNANTTAYFQAVGHADLFQDWDGNWWAASLAVRAGPEYLSYPMGRETVLTPVSWPEGEWPMFQSVSGYETGWHLPSPSVPERGEGQLVSAGDYITFPPCSVLPPHFLHWRLPLAENYNIEAANSVHANRLRLTSSALNLTAYDGYWTGGLGQTFVSRRQTDSFFTFRFDLDFSDLERQEDEAGISVFLVHRYHFDLGVVMLPASTTAINATDAPEYSQRHRDHLVPHLRFRGMSGSDASGTHTTPLPPSLLHQDANNNTIKELQLQLQAVNQTHYVFSAAPTRWVPGLPYERVHMGYATGAELSWGFTGTLVGAYATTNGRNGTGFEAWVGEWVYEPRGQVRSCEQDVGFCGTEDGWYFTQDAAG